jgi:hypothetical protein
MRAAAALSIVAAVAAGGRARAQTDYERLGRLERLEVDAVLAERGRALEPAPEGKTIRDLVVETRPVFSRDDGRVLRFFNVFHVTTRPRAIARELLFHPGERWSQEGVDEALRHLRDPLFHNVLVILPLATEDPGAVDALVVVRDVWSLRLNSRYDVQGLEIINLQLSISENNLFGWRKRLAVAMVMDQGDVELGPSYYDPNVGGTRLTLRSLGRLIFSRDGLDLEGTRSETQLAYPFWSLRTRWGGSLEVAHLVGTHRSFLGTELRTYDDPDTPAMEAAPWVYHRRELATELQVLRSFGSRVIVRAGGGHELARSRPALPDDFPDDPVLAAAFRRDVLPRSELSSALFARALLFTPIYAAYRDLDTFDLREDYQLGPSLEARASLARTELGSDRDFVRVSATARYAAGWGRGLYRVAASFGARLQDGRLIDRATSAGVSVATPRLLGVGRLLASFELDLLEEEEGNRFFVLGGANGLRAYAINEFAGLARVLAHVEARTRPLHIAFLRLGAVAFWDAGHAAPALSDLRLHHGVGAGLRLLIPQLDPLVIRLDWAFALTGDTAGWPGRVSLGVQQAF